MSNSSQPITYSITSTDLNDTITISNPASYNNSSGTVILNSGDTVLTNGILSGITIDSGNISFDNNSNYSNFWSVPEEWIDSFPEWGRVQDMIEKYPSLKIALQNFETIYKLVKDDYDNPTT